MGADRAAAGGESAREHPRLPSGTGAPGGPARAAAGGETSQETAVARSIRAEGLAAGLAAAEIARMIHARCAPAYGTTLVRAQRLALGIALADVVAQVRARYQAEGRTPPRFSQTLLSAYESGLKRPGPEYLHYLCCVYQAEPENLGYRGRCLCGHQHGGPAPALSPGRPGPGGPAPVVATSPAVTPAARPGVAGGATRPPPRVPPAAGQEAAPVPVTGAAGGAGRAGGLARVTPARTLTAAEAPPGGGPVPPAGWDGTGGRPGADDGWPAPGQPAAQAETDDDAVRRTLLRLTADAAGPVDSRFFGAAERIRRRLDDALVGATVSVTMLDHWEDGVAEYGRQYLTAPPLRLLCDVLLDLGDVRRMCEHRQPLEFGERLCGLAARLAGLAGMIMINVGDQRLARSFFRTARTAADETGGRQMRSWVAVREALVPLYYGDPRQAAAAARAAADLAGRQPSTAGVMAPIVEARAMARSREAGRACWRRVNAALDRAHEAFDGLPADQQAGTAFGYTERQLLFHQGDALLAVGDHRGADDAFGQALRLYSPAEFLDRSLITLGQARCRLVAGEPAEALRLSQETLRQLPSQHRPGLVLRAARSLGDAVAAEHGDVPAVRDYREALLTG